jgi:hypothetical protein
MLYEQCPEMTLLENEEVVASAEGPFSIQQHSALRCFPFADTNAIFEIFIE